MRLLVANRGEIARRILRTARRLKVANHVFYCRLDAELPFVREADRSSLLELDSPQATYLDGDRIISEMKAQGLTHLHPGYGFLAENADFVEKLERAGLHFIGPRAESIRALGDKQKSRRLLQDLKVPLIPAYEGDDQSDAAFLEKAKDMPFPLLIKPAAGGGGKGMLRVNHMDELVEALGSARRIAKNHFGDDRLLLETYIDQARHIEVQVFGDGEGHVLVLGERECSLQRRHQKVIEECPCSDLPNSIRQRLYAESKKLAEHLSYRSAGTLEWLWDGAEGIYFLEMNTRLQVEHPVTEQVYGIDLVAWQLELARSGEFPKACPPATGHSVEARLCAEDPQQDFLPSGGKIHRLELPQEIRADFGYYEKNEVSSQFDSMLGKLIAWGHDREEAISNLFTALEQTVLMGPITNRAYLLQILKSAAFRQQRISTQFLAQLPPRFDYFRALKWMKAEKEKPLPSCDDDDGLDLFSPWGAEPGVQNREWWADYDGKRYFALPFADWSETVTKEGLAAVAGLGEEELDPIVKSPMPAKVVKLNCQKGQSVKKGESLMILEAMKMEHNIRASFDGRVKELFVQEGQQLPPEEALVELESL